MSVENVHDPSYCLVKAREYSTKAVGADQRLKETYEALAREYILWADFILKNQSLEKTLRRDYAFLESRRGSQMNSSGNR
jgi:hypothetical protein